MDVVICLGLPRKSVLQKLFSGFAALLSSLATIVVDRAIPSRIVEMLPLESHHVSASALSFRLERNADCCGT